MLILAVSALVVFSLTIFYWWFPSVPASLPSLPSVPTAPPPSLPSSSTARRWKYDVFLSFRGPDTRRSFTFELYYGLQNRGIRTFIDEEDLEKGDEISPTLLKAIDESWFAIIVLSKQYASSTWCLEELTKICQSMTDPPNRILPVFYQVEPTHVRYQKGSFEEAFTKHETSGRYIQEKMQQWKEALKKVADFSGWNSNAFKTDRLLIENIVQVVCKSVQPIAIKNADFEAIRGKLELKLESANVLVDDAEEKQLRKPEVKKWLFMLKDTIYHARDLLDEINTDALRRKIEADESGSSSSSSSDHQVQNFCSTSMDEKRLKSEMARILETLKTIMDEKDTLGIKAGDESWPKSRNRETTSLVDDSGVYGRDQDKETIKKLLLSDDATDEKIGVIPIVGMGGIGKTTLAQLLYKDVKHGFDLQAWVCVSSEEFDILRVTQQIYGSITKSNYNNKQLDQLQVELRDCLENKKFLLVLDDVWHENYNDWEGLKLCLSFGASGSRIIVTTRNDGVASMMGTLQSYYLNEISDEDCWSIFAKHAFGSKANVIGTQHPDLAEIGRQIAKKCKGLPLSAKSLGGLMRGELNKEKWEMILKSEMWLTTIKESDVILPALWISYRYLPSHLKRCFAYCSIFPKDYEFTKSDLILMWMAEDLLQPVEGKMMEEVGEDYFKTLISRSFFQLLSDGVETDTFDIVGDESVFCMHDLINDLAKYVSGEFCLRLDYEISPDHESKIRHFFCLRNSCVGMRDADSNEVEGDADSNDLAIVTLKKAKSLHTLIFFSSDFSYIRLPKELSGLCQTWECLRLLNLSGCDVSELPSSIGNFKHLRHLNLSRTKIEELPETLCTLYNMQTLLLGQCPLVQLPTNLGRLVKLRHLHIGGIEIQKMAPHMGRLKDLQYLDEFKVSKDAGYTIAELKELRHLGRTLRIWGLKNIVSDKEALEANMRSKKNLKGLVLEWSEGYEEQESSEGEYEEESSEGEYEEKSLEKDRVLSEGSEGVTESSEESSKKDILVLEQLQPHTNLKELEIVSYRGTKFPSWVGDHSFKNLVSVELLDCEFCFSLPPLGQLPSLEKLRIEGLNGVVSIGSEFHGNNTGGVQPFRSLKELRIDDMLELQEWVYVGGDQEEEFAIFPNLECLELSNCPKLTNTFPLDKIQNLEDVSLSSLKSFAGPLSQESECPKFLSLTSLCIINCPEFVRFSDGGGIDAPKLKSISIYDCVKLGSLPERMHTLLPSLTELYIKYCPELESFPEGGLPPSLHELSLSDLKSFADPLSQESECPKFLSLTSLRIYNCPEFVRYSDGGGIDAPKLETLWINECVKLRSLPERMHTLLPSLTELWIEDCPELESFPEGGLPPALKSLRLGRNKKLFANRKQWGLPALKSLEQFTIECGSEESEEEGSSFPEEGLLPANLTHLHLFSIPNLTSIDGKQLRHLNSLQKLSIWNCPKVECFPEEGLPTSLKKLKIWECPLLEERCARGNGQDWPKIAHIPYIELNQRQI